jgi:putative oxidoreductase
MTDHPVLAAFPHLAGALQLSLGGIFLFTGVAKLLHPFDFMRSVAAYAILPTGLVRLSALGLIMVEGFLALAFLTGWLTEIALPLAAIVLVAFLVAIGINLRRGRRIPCGCLGGASETISPRALGRLLLLLTAVLLLSLTKWGGSATPKPGEIYTVDTAFVAAFLVLTATWLLSLPEVITLIRPRRTTP